MQDFSLPHFHLEVWCYLNNIIPGGEIGRGGQQDTLFIVCGLPGHQTLAPAILSVGVQERVFVPTLPVALQDRSETSNCWSCESNNWRPGDLCVARNGLPFWWCPCWVHTTLRTIKCLNFLSPVMWRVGFYALPFVWSIKWKYIYMDDLSICIGTITYYCIVCNISYDLVVICGNFAF